MKLHEKLARLRDAAGISQADLGRVIGVDGARISRIEAGKGRLYVDQAAALARALGVSLDFLVDEAQAEPPAPGGPALSEDEAYLLKTAREIGLEVAKGRLLLKPGVVSREATGFYEPDPDPPKGPRKLGFEMEEGGPQDEPPPASVRRRGPRR